MNLSRHMDRQRLFIVTISSLLAAIIILRYQIHQLNIRITVQRQKLNKCSSDANSLRMQLMQKVNVKSGSVRNTYTGNIRQSRKAVPSGKRDRHLNKYGCLFCQMYDLESEPSGYNYECIRMNSRPSITICIQPPVNSSKDAKSALTWTGDTIREFQFYLRKDVSFGLIDVGCGVGAFSILAAMMGHRVLSLEANPDHVIRFHSAVKMQTSPLNITLLENRVGDIRGVNEHSDKRKGRMHAKKVGTKSKSNAGKTIHMNDLLYRSPFKRAILKVDTDDPHKAFRHAEKLFETIQIPVVMMTWAPMAEMYDSSPGGDDARQIDDMVDFFLDRGYTPIDIARYILPVQVWNTWPSDIFWVHRDFKMS